MPTDIWFWIVVAALIAAIVGLAIWRNRGLNFEFGTGGVKVETQTSKEYPASRVSVAEQAKIGENAAVGNIIGNEGSPSSVSANQSVDVAKQLDIGKNSKVGNIIGNKVVGPSEPRQ
jgi:hypothetical protein